MISIKHPIFNHLVNKNMVLGEHNYVKGADQQHLFVNKTGIIMIAIEISSKYVRPNDQFTMLHKR